MDKSRWNLVRGERIIQALEHAIEEATLNQLQQGTVSGFPGTPSRQNSTDPVQIQQKVYTVYVTNSSLLAEGLANNQGRRYNPEIFAEGVVFEPEDSPENITVPTTNGEDHSFQPIDMSKNNVRTRCNCLDFHYRFAHTNAKAQSLYGDPPPAYQRRTTTHPPANPSKVPGLCKHLIALVDDLKSDGVIR